MVAFVLHALAALSHPYLTSTLLYLADSSSESRDVAVAKQPEEATKQPEVTDNGDIVTGADEEPMSMKPGSAPSAVSPEDPSSSTSGTSSSPAVENKEASALQKTPPKSESKVRMLTFTN